MSITHSIHIAAPCATVFALYEDVSTWPAWDHETREVFLPEGLRPGATGWLQPRSGPKARVRVASVTPGQAFTMEGRLPLCRMSFDHTLAPAQDGGTRATHAIRFSGPLSFVFRRLIGRGLAASLPDTLEGLKQASEARGLAE